MKNLHSLMCLAAISLPAEASMADGNLSEYWAHLDSMVLTGKIAEIKVEIAPEANIPTNITAADLRSGGAVTMIFKSVARHSFGSLLYNISTKPAAGTPDLRWAVFLYDSKRKEVGSLFLDGSGEMGYLDDKLVSFQSGEPKSNMLQRLRAIVTNAMR
jgi:hypothetical protein